MTLIKIGDKIVEVDDETKVIKATTEEIHHEDGRVDIIIHVPCMEISAKKE